MSIKQTYQCDACGAELSYYTAERRTTFNIKNIPGKGEVHCTRMRSIEAVRDICANRPCYDKVYAELLAEIDLCNESINPEYESISLLNLSIRAQRVLESRKVISIDSIEKRYETEHALVALGMTKLCARETLKKLKSYRIENPKRKT